MIDKDLASALLARDLHADALADRHRRRRRLRRLGHARAARDPPRDSGGARRDGVRGRLDGAEGARRLLVRRGDRRPGRDRLDLRHAGAAPRRGGHDRHARGGRARGRRRRTDRTTEGDGEMATAEKAPAASDGLGDAPAVAWHTLAPDDVVGRLGVDPGSGLSAAEASSRLASVGPNKFTETAVEPRWRAFVRQYRDPMQIVLLVAGIGSLYPLKELGTGPRPALPDAVQRRARPAPGGQGGRGGRGAAEDDDRQGARASRRRARPDPGRGARARATSSRSRPATSCRPTGACCRRRRSRWPSRR